RMTCTRARWLAALATRGELGARQDGMLQAHLGGCEACRAAVGETKRLEDGLRVSLGRLPAVDLRPAVMRRLADTSPAPRPLPFPRRIPARTAFAAVGAMTALFGWLLLRGHTAVPGPPGEPIAANPAPVVAELQTAPGSLIVEPA